MFIFFEYFFADQLSINNPVLLNIDKDDLLLFYEPIETFYDIKHHKQKITFIISSLRHFIKTINHKNIIHHKITKNNKLDLSSYLKKIIKENNMKVAVQMDHVSKLNIKGDTTLALCLEAQEREFKLYQYLPDNLTFVDGKLKVLVEELKLFDDNVDFFELGEPFVDDLNSFDTVLMRQEPPFDMHYITYTHLLDHLDKRVRVINNPVSVRNSPEKLLVTHFIDLMPKTIISKNFSEIKEFSNKQNKVVLKPLYGKGGEGIILLQADEQMFDKKLEDFLSNEYEPIMVQEYLPIVKKGDKRIILINGEPVGCLNRVPAISRLT